MGQAKMSQATTDFVENKGQWNERGKFLFRGVGLNFWVTQTGLLLDYYVHSGKSGLKGQVLGLNFVGGNRHASVSGAHKTSLITQYLRPSQPAHVAPSFKDVFVKGIYAGVDLHAYKTDGVPRYDLVLAPGADPNKIRMKVDGTTKISLDKRGNLAMATTLGDLKLQGLYAYQMVGGQKKQVPARFKIGDRNTVQFTLGTYDRSRSLIIDPIIYGSYYGGDHGSDEVRAVVADADGGVFMTGNTSAIDFPLVLGPYITLSGNSDAFISKFQGDAYVHNFSSYIGGTSDETGKFIAVDPSGNHIWIAGTTSSATFPLVGAGSFQQTRIGTSDTFIMEWTKDPVQVLTATYATYFGSSSATNGEELKGFGIGPLTGDIFLAGTTKGAGIPGAINAYPGASTNAFITRMNNAATAVTWTRYIEGSAAQSVGISDLLGIPAGPPTNGTNPGTTNTEADITSKMATNALAIDKDENAVICGTVNFQGNQDTSIAPNPGFKTTPGVFQNPVNGQNGRLLRNSDIFVEKLDPTGALVYGCLVGGADNDRGSAVAVDATGNAYVTGVAGSFDFPRTPGTFGQIFTQDPVVTVTKLNQDASLIVYSTNLRTKTGGKGALYPVGIAIDGRGFAFVTGMILDGTVFSTAFPPPDPDTPIQAIAEPGNIPVTPDATRGAYTYPGNPDVPAWDGWLIVIDDTATSEIYGTYLGGTFDDGVFPPYTDRFGDVWLTGWTDLTRAYLVSDSAAQTFTSFPQSGAGAGIGQFVTPLAFKSSGEQPNPLFFQVVQTPYAYIASSPGGPGGQVGLWWAPDFSAAGPLGYYIPTWRTRDGYVMRYRLQIPIITSLVLNPATIPGGLGATTTGTITLDTPATGAGVDVVVTLSDVSAASFDPTLPQDTLVVNIPAGQTTGTFTVYSSPVTDPTQVDIKASYLGNFKSARLTVVPWLQNFVLSPNTVVGGNNVSGVITLAAPAPAGGLDVSLLTNDASTILFPGGNTVNVPAGQDFTNFVIQTKGVDAQQNFTVTVSALNVGITQTLTLKPASLLSVTFQPGRVAGGTPSTGTVRLDGLPGPSGFTVNLAITGSPAGYSLVPPTLNFTPNDNALTFVVNTAPEPVNTQRVIVATRPAQGTYTLQSKSGTLFVDANFLTNFTLNPTTVNAGQTSTGTVTISNAAQAGGVVVNLLSDNTNVATVPATVVIPAGQTSATFTVTTLATAVTTVVNIHAIRGTTDISRPLTVNGVTFTITANPTSVIGGASPITGTVTLALDAPAGGVTVNLTSSNPAAASVPPSVLIPAGSRSQNFTISTFAVATTQNVTITGTTGSATANTIIQIRAISLANVEFNPSYVKGGTFTACRVSLDAPAPAGGATVTLVSSTPSVLNVGPIFIPAGQSQSTWVTVPVARVNRTFAVIVTGQYNGRQISATVTVHR